MTRSGSPPTARVSVASDAHQRVVLRPGLVLGVVPEQLRPAPGGEVGLPGAQVGDALVRRQTPVVADLGGGRPRAGGQRGPAEHVGHLGVVPGEVHHPRAPGTWTRRQRIDAHPVAAEPVLEQRPARRPEQRHALGGVALARRSRARGRTPRGPRCSGGVEVAGRSTGATSTSMRERGAGRVPLTDHELAAVRPGLEPRRDAHLEVEHQGSRRCRARRKHGRVGAAGSPVDREERDPARARWPRRPRWRG